ncbi:MAG TPA: hypothetical protein VIL65_13170 [Beijerinckiaceae bacterium]|jgi:hypothetical protein
MLAELTLRFGAVTTESARRLGFVRASVALWSRATRHRRAWAPHEARCHAAVRRSLADLPRRGTVVVLGSGLVRDVPIDDLLSTFERIVLVDAVHLWPVRRRFRREPKVSFVVRDLSGHAGLLERGDPPRADPLADICDGPSLDLVISANLLSQLPLAAEDILEDGADLPPDLPRRIVEAHLADLASLPCRVCLLTDVVMRDVAPDGTVLDSLDLLRGVALPEPDEAWDWTVAPRGEISRRFAVIHHVHAYADLAASRARSGLRGCDGEGRSSG